MTSVSTRLSAEGRSLGFVERDALTSYLAHTLGLWRLSPTLDPTTLMDLRTSTIIVASSLIGALTLACGPAQIGDPPNDENNTFLDPNNGAVNNDDVSLNNDGANNDSNNGDPNNGTTNNGDPNNGTTNNGDPNNGGDPCADVTCPTMAICAPETGACACTGGTELIDGVCVAPDPCANIQCPAMARCDPDTLDCECTGGTVMQNGVCTTPDPGDPANRPEAEVCGALQESNANIVRGGFTPGGDACDPGTLSQDAIDASVSRLNLYRWLTGLAPMVDDPEQNRVSQLCAVIQGALGDLEHYPGPEAPCYTMDGAAAAGSSNLAAGSADTSAAIDQLIEDRFSTSVGHRRWMLLPRMYYTGMGYAVANTRYTNYYCQYVDFYRSGPDRIEPEYVAWPNPGYTPAAFIPAKWSFTSASWTYPRETVVTVTRLSDNSELPVETYYTAGGGPGAPPILVWDFGQPPAGNSDYEVRLSGVSLNGQSMDLVYTVKPTSCQ